MNVTEAPPDKPDVLVRLTHDLLVNGLDYTAIKRIISEGQD